MGRPGQWGQVTVRRVSEPPAPGLNDGGTLCRELLTEHLHRLPGRVRFEARDEAGVAGGYELAYVLDPESPVVQRERIELEVIEPPVETRAGQWCRDVDTDEVVRVPHPMSNEPRGCRKQHQRMAPALVSVLGDLARAESTGVVVAGEGGPRRREPPRADSLDIGRTLSTLRIETYQIVTCRPLWPMKVRALRHVRRGIEEITDD